MQKSLGDSINFNGNVFFFKLNKSPALVSNFTKINRIIISCRAGGFYSSTFPFNRVSCTRMMLDPEK